MKSFFALLATLSLFFSCARHPGDDAPIADTFIFYHQCAHTDTSTFLAEEFYILFSSDSTYRDSVCFTDFSLYDEGVYYTFSGIEANKRYTLLSKQAGGFPYPVIRDYSGRDLLTQSQ